ncbi:Fibrillin-2-like [Oopsacas minuta]|uniref:Fibrillin-2-like n=1 Tax=Oopsacas minuta TaxID=111878 RepID=A0AAV7JFL7_9METZ|nr:Fibrillin-2-like [Oopsacas minuta]
MTDINACLNRTSSRILTISKNISSEIVLILNSPVGSDRLYFQNIDPIDRFVIRSSVHHLSVGSIYFSKYEFYLDQPDNFFAYFPQVNSIVTSNSYLTFGFRPSFSKLSFLRYLDLTASDPNGDYEILTPDMLGNLSLAHLKWSGSLKAIEAGAFDGLSDLQTLDLSGNQITALPGDLFTQTEQIRSINLNRNMIKSLSIDIFNNLDEISTISIDNNPNFLYDSLQRLSTIQTISLRFNSYTTLDPFVFQQLHKLTEVNLEGNPFVCDCDLRWVLFMASSGVDIIGGTCFSPSAVYMTNITDEHLYSGCPTFKTYPCFDKSITCSRTDFLCHNIGDEYLCSCPVGLALTHTNECVDINECTASGTNTKCEVNCINSIGSYQCTCDSGYRLELNGWSCEDINECRVDNGGCIGGCRNVPGSYICYCESGYMAVNATGCERDITEYLYITWGSIVSVFLLLLLVILVTICIFLCYIKCSGKPSVKFLEQRPLSTTPSSYTRMESVKPDVPPNRPRLPPTKEGSRTDIGRQLSQPIVHEELTYEAFDL